MRFDIDMLRLAKHNLLKPQLPFFPNRIIKTIIVILQKGILGDEEGHLKLYRQKNRKSLNRSNCCFKSHVLKHFPVIHFTLFS